jgi:hypothetical protein
VPRARGTSVGVILGCPKNVLIFDVEGPITAIDIFGGFTRSWNIAKCGVRRPRYGNHRLFRQDTIPFANARGTDFSGSV